ncbi:hypothetical protein [Paenimyroides baculatum]|uniref:Uncharacterized protein n=1 Tax=Paenimyroides baculatum TaxID=2608000 RepID=A0A5M6CQM6_9FLAO|nr:hypothetical protein [Paenimyroides baculatum]KAA5537628.1 hypothetical protein F0460_02835 [Paenimyroides baculatum]
MNAEFINKPISGEYHEKHFGSITPHCLWVKFTNDENEWVGSFETGWVEEVKLIFQLKDQKAFIIANGHGYLIDLVLKEQINESIISHIESALYNAENDTIYFIDGFDIKYVNCDGSVDVLFSEYIFDKITLTKIKDNKLHAEYWHYQTSTDSFDFEFDLITKEIKDFFPIEAKQTTTYKPKISLVDRIKKYFKKI